MSLNLLDNNPRVFLDAFKSAYYNQYGETIQIGSDAFAVASVYAYCMSVFYNQINNDTQNRFIDTAQGVYLDAIAANYGIEKRPGGYKATASFSLVYNESIQAIPAKAIIIQANNGMQFTNPYAFSVTDDHPVLQAVDAGTEYNGIPIGAITEIIEGGLYITSATNTTITAGGTDGFGDDDTYRQWLKTQIQSFAGCGTHLAYEARARNADTRVLDVYVLKQGESGYQKGKVKIYILTNPDTDLHNQVLFLVREACTDPTFRPIGDYVEVSYAGVTNADVSCTIQVTYPLKFYDLGAARNNRILAEYKRLLSQQINRPFKFDELCSMLTAKDTDGIYALDAKPTNLTANTYTEPIYPVLGSTLNITSLPFSTVYSNR